MGSRLLIAITGVLLASLTPGVPDAANRQSPSPCEPAPEVRQALASLPNVGDYRVPYEERMLPLRRLLDRYPRDLFVQRRYQDVFRQKFTMYQEFDRALAWYRSRPADPFFRYLEARLTGGFDGPKADEMLNDLIASQPDFPWAHLGIVELADRPGARNTATAETHLRAFLAACPSSVDGYALLRTVENPELIRSSAPRFRALLEARVDSWSLPYWRYLWDLEFRSSPKEEQEAVRQRVVKDVAVLQKHPLEASREWHSLFQYAATLTKDEAILSWLEDTVLTRFPTSPLAPTVESARWSRAHPRPGPKSNPEETKAFFAIERAWTDEFQKRWPQDSNVVWDRWMALSGSLATLPLEDRLAIVDAFASMMRRSPDAGSMNPPLPVRLADYYVRWGVRLDQVPELIQEGLRDTELENRYQRDASVLAEDVRSTQPDPVALSIWRTQLTLAEFYLRQHRLGEARDAIQIGQANVERRPMFLPETDHGKRDADAKRRGWHRLEGRLAELEGDPQKALAFYQSFMQPNARMLAGIANASPGPELSQQIAEIKKFYLANGGSEESWLEWVASGPKPDPAATVLDALRYDVILPEFAARDLSGRTWRLADLKGKATFIDVWATWCGVCRAQHPKVQELYEAVKGRRDIQVLSFNRDEAAYLADSYMKEKHYAFPVIASKDLVEKLYPVAGLPMYWIIDARGRRSSPYWGIITSVDRTIADLEAAAQRR